MKITVLYQLFNNNDKYKEENEYASGTHYKIYY